eukprot:767394-Hanusia_phi.AAC.3
MSQAAVSRRVTGTSESPGHLHKEGEMGTAGNSARHHQKPGGHFLPAATLEPSGWSLEVKVEWQAREKKGRRKGMRD